jgi:hypothetical protein
VERVVPVGPLEKVSQDEEAMVLELEGTEGRQTKPAGLAPGILWVPKARFSMGQQAPGARVKPPDLLQGISTAWEATILTENRNWLSWHK